MSESQSQNTLQGKGWCFLYLVGGFILFFLLWYFVISGNNNSLPSNK